MGPPRQSPVKFEKKLQMPQCQPILSEVTRGSKPLFAHDTNGTEMLIRGVFFFNYVLFFPVWLDISDSLLDFTGLYCVDGRQHMQGEEYLNIDGAQPG